MSALGRELKVIPVIQSSFMAMQLSFKYCIDKDVETFMLMLVGYADRCAKPDDKNQNGGVPPEHLKLLPLCLS